MRRRRTQQPTRQYDDAMTMTMMAAATATTKRKWMKTRTRTRTTTMMMTMMRTRTRTCGGGKHNNQPDDTMTYNMTNDILDMSPICRQRVGNASATTSLADIIFDHVGNMSANMSPTISDMSACWRFRPFSRHLKRRNSQLSTSVSPNFLVLECSASIWLRHMKSWRGVSPTVDT